jgi:hypothetical protein
MTAALRSLHSAPKSAGGLQRAFSGDGPSRVVDYEAMYRSVSRMIAVTVTGAIGVPAGLLLSAPVALAGQPQTHECVGDHDEGGDADQCHSRPVGCDLAADERSDHFRPKGAVPEGRSG